MFLKSLKMLHLVLGFSVINSMFYISETIEDSDWTTPNSGEKITRVNNFTINSALVKGLLEHFKNPDSINNPLPIPDSLILPDHEYSVFAGKMYGTNVTAYGISRVKIENFTCDIVEMKVHFGLRLGRFELIGNYSYHNWIKQQNSGAFNVTIINGFTESDAKLEITADGELSAEEITMNLLSHDDLIINIENAGLVGMFVNQFGAQLFSAIKPYCFRVISENIRGTLNNGLKRFKIMYPNSIAPVDLGIAELRKLMKTNGFDPHYAADYQYASNIYSVDVTGIKITGLSSVYRVGDVKLRMENNVVNVVVNAETEILEGSCIWEAGIAGILTKAGQAAFTIEYVNLMMSVNQSLDIRNKPKVADFKVSLGNIQLRVDGAGTLDYLAEVGANVLPNMLRYQILQAAETPMRRKVQEALDNTDVEKFILDSLPLMDDQLYRHNFTKIVDNFIDEQLELKMDVFDETADL